MRVVFEHEGECPSQWSANLSIAQKFGLSSPLGMYQVMRETWDDGFRDRNKPKKASSVEAR